MGGSNREGNVKEGIVCGGKCPWWQVTGGEMSARELSVWRSARGGKRRGELPGSEVSGYRLICYVKTVAIIYFTINIIKY